MFLYHCSYKKKSVWALFKLFKINWVKWNISMRKSYRETCLKRTLMGLKKFSALCRCPPWTGPKSSKHVTEMRLRHKNNVFSWVPGTTIFLNGVFFPFYSAFIQRTPEPAFNSLYRCEDTIRKLWFKLLSFYFLWQIRGCPLWTDSS